MLFIQPVVTFTELSIKELSDNKLFAVIVKV